MGHFVLAILLSSSAEFISYRPPTKKKRKEKKRQAVAVLDINLCEKFSTYSLLPSLQFKRQETVGKPGRSVKHVAVCDRFFFCKRMLCKFKTHLTMSDQGRHVNGIDL